MPVSGSKQIRVMVVEDMPVTLAGTVEALRKSPDIKVVAACGSREDALQQFSQDGIDVVLFDLQLHGIPEWRTIKRMKAIAPETPIVVYSALQEKLVADEAMRIADGFLDKHTPLNEYPDAIRQAHYGYLVAKKNILKRATKLKAGFTPCEKDIISLMQQGVTTGKAISDRVNCKGSTVYSHGEKLCEKLGLNNWRELVIWAINQPPIQ